MDVQEERELLNQLTELFNGRVEDVGFIRSVINTIFKIKAQPSFGLGSMQGDSSSLTLASSQPSFPSPATNSSSLSGQYSQ
jgi:hypothetical protein